MRLSRRCIEKSFHLSASCQELNIDERYMRVVLRVQMHWKVYTARKKMAQKVAQTLLSASKFLRRKHLTQATRRTSRASCCTGRPSNFISLQRVSEAKYIIANNLPVNDAHWDSDDPAWVGKASMSKRHRFLIRRNLHWRWFNALIFGISAVRSCGRCFFSKVCWMRMRWSTQRSSAATMPWPR